MEKLLGYEPSNVGSNPTGSTKLIFKIYIIYGNGGVLKWLRGRFAKSLGRKSRGFETHLLRH